MLPNSMNFQGQTPAPDSVPLCQLFASPIQFLLTPLELVVPNNELAILPVECLQASVQAFASLF
jgi:hypothetical protein